MDQHADSEVKVNKNDKITNFLPELRLKAFISNRYDHVKKKTGCFISGITISGTCV